MVPFQATEEELQANARPKRTAAKAKPRAKKTQEPPLAPPEPTEEEIATPPVKIVNRKKNRSGRSGPSEQNKSMADTGDTPVRSPPKKHPKQCTGPPPRRLAFKTPDPDQTRCVSALQKAGYFGLI